MIWPALPVLMRPGIIGMILGTERIETVYEDETEDTVSGAANPSRIARPRRSAPLHNLLNLWESSILRSVHFFQKGNLLDSKLLYGELGRMARVRLRGT